MDKSMILVRFKTIIPGQSKNIIEELNFQLFFFMLKKFSNNIEIIVKNISKEYNRNMKTVPMFIKQPRK